MIKKLAQSIREYKKDVLLTPTIVAVEVIMEVFIPFMMARVIDNGIGNGDLDYIVRTGLILILAALISLAAGAFAGNYAARASAGFAKNLRQDMYHRIQEYSFANIDKFSTSSLVTRLTTDITNVQNAFQMIIRTLVRAPLMLIFSLFMAFQVNHRLSLIFLGAVPVLAAGLYLIMTKAHPVFEKVFKKYDLLNNVVQENLRGIRVVKSYVRENEEIGKFEAVSQQIFRGFSKAEKILAFNAPLMQFTMYAAILSISWLGGQMIVSQTMTTGELVSLIAYLGQILMSLMMISMVFVMVTISRASAERIIEVLEEESSLKNKPQPVREVLDGSVSFEQVDFSYANDPQKLALKNATFSVRPGETIGIIGGTGSAKTTLVQLIPRLYDVTNGFVKVGGVDVRDYDMDALRGAIGMVLQKNVLFSGTILDNLRWGNQQATDEELMHAARLAQADEFIQRFPDGYHTYIEEGGSNVSGGQKQRLCIARALVKKPKILILDDSTSAVDTRTDMLIRQAFAHEIPHTTKFIIAQRIASVEDADRIIVMDKGEINDIGTHEELLDRNTIYREVYESQVKGGTLNEEAI